MSRLGRGRVDPRNCATTAIELGGMILIRLLSLCIAMNVRAPESRLATLDGSEKKSPQEGAVAGKLFRRRDLFDRRSFDIGLANFIGIIQELADDTGAFLLLDPSLLRFLLLSQEWVIYFPAHCVLHP